MTQESPDYEQLLVELKDKNYLLTVKPFAEEIDVDGLVQIDYSNIFGEILTFPVLFNRIGLLKAEVNNLVALEKFDCDVLFAQLSEEHSKRIVASGEKATEKKVNDAVLLDVRYITKKKQHLKYVKQAEQIDSLYWSAKSKDGKLDKLTDKLRPEEFSLELLQDVVNGVMIKKVKKLID